MPLEGFHVLRERGRGQKHNFAGAADLKITVEMDPPPPGEEAFPCYYREVGDVSIHKRFRRRMLSRDPPYFKSSLTIFQCGG